MIDTKLKELENAFHTADKTLTDRSARAAEWERINTLCFTEVETLANHFRKLLLLIPSTPNRRNELANTSFQRLIDASQKLLDWFGIDVFKGITVDEQAFLTLTLQRRHITVHNGGVVDEDYLRKSGDTSARLHQKIQIRSREIRRLIPIVRTACTNFLSDFASLS